MPHALAIFSYSAADQLHVEVKFLGDRPKKPVFTADTFRMSVKNDSSYEPDAGFGADTTISGLKIAVEAARIDTSTVRCVHLKHTPEWKDENIEIESHTDSPVYVLHTSGANKSKEFDKWRATAKIREIEKKRDKPGRFAILFYDDSEGPFDRENFLQTWAPSVKEVVTEGNKQVFDALEIRKLQEYKQKGEEAALELEQREKRRRFLKSLKWFLAPTFWVHFVVFLTTVGCVLSGIDSILSEPFLLSAIAPILMGGVFGGAVISVCAATGGLLVLLIWDYHNCEDRVSLHRPDYNFLSYMADIPTRLLNWHRDCSYQFVPFYIGLAGSILLAIIVGSLGVDLPVLNFISHVIETGFHGIGFSTPPGMEAVAAANLQIFTTVLFTLMPLTLGSMVMHVARTFEEGILPSRDKEIAAAKLSEDCSTLAVRFHDGLSAELSVQDDLKASITVTKVGYSKDRLFLFDEDKQLQVDTPSARLHDALMHSPGNCKVSVV